MTFVWYRPRKKSSLMGSKLRWPTFQMLAFMLIVHVDNGPKFGLRPSISWTNSDVEQILSLKVDEWTDFFYHGPSTSWTNSDDGPRNYFEVDHWTDF